MDGQLIWLSGARSPLEISRGIVRLNAKLYGRGPVKAKTYIHDDYVVCVLQSVFTTAERTLIEHRQGERGEAARAQRSPRRPRSRSARSSKRRLAERSAAASAECTPDLDTATKVFLLEPCSRQLMPATGIARSAHEVMRAREPTRLTGPGGRTRAATSGFEWIWLMYTITSRSTAASTTG